MERKGQSLVEFALVFPFFIFLVFALIYSGMLFYDYSTLSNVARSAVREASLAANEPVENRYPEIEAHYNVEARRLITALYEPAEEGMVVITQDPEYGVHATIQMRLGTETNYIMRSVLPSRFAIRYFMAKEKRQ